MKEPTKEEVLAWADKNVGSVNIRLSGSWCCEVIGRTLNFYDGPTLYEALLNAWKASNK